MSPITAVPVPDAFETRTNATFEALMWALSRPGTAQDLPAPGMAGIAETLVDRECRVWCDDPALADRIACFGAALTPLPRADHCFLSLAGTGTLDRLAHVALGSALYPDAGATLVAEAHFGSGTRLRLTGPGIETAADLRLDGIAPEFWALRTALCRYPAGFDLFLICGAAVIGLPRSTAIEVL
ncbi:MAG: phosphonate C-P lyase system protein PhnH [Tabrizicola sp.]|nr:phosphonate C-P lyase system protein PhnH [Tabrizicola sp.]